jgi:DNA polymerase-3 subunit alpha
LETTKHRGVQNKMNYVPLHVHSHFSLLDGLSQPQQIADRCTEIGARACALTDHGNIAGAVKFYTAMKKAKIKPILGCELYICYQDPTIQEKENRELSHFIVLAKNYKGWKDLIKIVSASNKPEHYYHKPRLDLETLGKLNSGNLMAITGHLGSTLADAILDQYSLKSDWLKLGIDHVNKLKQLFGDYVFLEAQLMDKDNLSIQEDLTNAVREIGKQTNTRVICTPDAHYCRREDAIDQRILLCNNIKTTFPEISRKISNDEDVPLSCFFTSDNYHIPSQEEISSLHTDEEISNTNFVADLVEDYDILSKPKLPPFNCPNNLGPDEYLRELCRQGWKEKIAKVIAEEDQTKYVDRIKYELGVLQGAGLSSYFLIVQDIVNYVRKNNWLPGPGRGSAAGCLVSYLIGITSIDPIKYGLLFDRFYNVGRNTADHISMPDIDVDVPIDKRELIIEYIKDKYGHDKVSQMITFNTIKGRGALKDVLRVYGNISFEEMNNITKNIPDEAKIADELQEMKEETGESSIIRWALENNVDKLKEWCYIDDGSELQGPLSKRFEQSIRLEGTKSNQSKHAAGIAISSEPLSEICPMIYDSKNKQLIAGMEMQDLESIGIIKFDILGVAMLDKIMTIQDLLSHNEDLGDTND